MGGLKRVLASFGAVLVGMAGLASTASPAGAATGVTTLVSVDGGVPMHKAGYPAMSEDASRVAFVANGDGQRNVVLLDRAAGTRTQVVNDAAEFTRISGDGSLVIYRRLESVYAYDVASATTVLIASNAQVGGVSRDGRFVSYSSQSGAYVLDRTAGTTTPVPAPAWVYRYGIGPISDDGQIVVFSLTTSGDAQTMVWNRATNSVTTVGDAGVEDMSSDGRYLALTSRSRLTPQDPNLGRSDVYVLDLATGTTSFVGANFADDHYSSGDSYEPRISDDGRLVAYSTDALVAGKWEHDRDIVLADRVAGTLSLVSLAADGTPAGSSGFAQMSGDGRFIAFASSAIDIVSPFDTSECAERDFEDGVMTVNYGNCANIYIVDRAATAVGSGGGTVTEGQTSVFVPAGFPGTVSITTATSPAPIPTGYEILGQQLVIEAPTATWSSPLRLTFTVDGASGVAANDIAVIRDGVTLVDCPGATTALAPDATSADGYPCVTSRTTLADGDVVLVVLTPHASVWTTAKVPPPVTPTVTFASLCEATQTAAGQKGIASALCAKLSAASDARQRGDNPAAANQLDAYRNQLAAQSGKALTAAQAADLTEKSRLL